MSSHSPAQPAGPWILLAKAENRLRLGLTNEAVIIADEAAQTEIAAYVEKLGVPRSLNCEEMPKIVEKRIGFPSKNLRRLREFRRRAERITEDRDLTTSDAEAAIAIAENLMTHISEREEGLAYETRATEFAPPARSPDPENRSRPSRGDPGQFETEFVTKLLLVKAILGSKKKRIPHFIGSMITILSTLICIIFGLIGLSGIILSFTGSSLLSISGLLVNSLFLLVAYICLKMTFYIRGETK